VTFEGSIPYHRLSTELILTTMMQLDRAGVALARDAKPVLRRALSFIIAYTRDDGSSPVIGDADDGRLWWWELPRVRTERAPVTDRYRDFLDHRHLLTTGGLWLKDPALVAAGGQPGAEAWWLFGAAVSKVAAAPAASASSSAAFPDGGIYVLRAPNRHAIVDAGPHGQAGLGGHAHNDILHLELWADGVAWLVDGGVGIYAPDLTLRNRLRSTAAHNTVVLDEQEQWPFDPRRPFLLPASEAPAVLSWDTDDTRDWLDVSSNAYQRLPSPATHRRRLLFSKRLDGWTVADDLITADDHSVRWLLHFGPSIDLTATTQRRYTARHASGKELSLDFTFPSTGEFNQTVDIASFSYGTTEPTTTLEWRGTAPARASFRMTLLSVSENTSPGKLDRRHAVLMEAFNREAAL
jgi:hypothetical protein